MVQMGDRAFHWMVEARAVRLVMTVVVELLLMKMKKREMKREICKLVEKSEEGVGKGGSVTKGKEESNGEERGVVCVVILLQWGGWKVSEYVVEVCGCVSVNREARDPSDSIQPA